LKNRKGQTFTILNRLIKPSASASV
jgi:hypothetical protein